MRPVVRLLLLAFSVLLCLSVAVAEEAKPKCACGATLIGHRTWLRGATAHRQDREGPRKLGESRSRPIAQQEPSPKGQVETTATAVHTPNFRNCLSSSNPTSGLMTTVTPRIIVETAEEEEGQAPGMLRTVGKPTSTVVRKPDGEIIMGGVTPRIIITGEEEERIGVVAQP
jgi:hypothetical protein